MTRFKGLSSINPGTGSSASLTSGTPGNDFLQMDAPITIGQLPIPLNNGIALVNAALTDNNAGQANASDYSINVAAGQVAIIPIVCSEYVKQITSFLSTLSTPALNNSGQYADNSGDAPIAKGTKITGFEVTYSMQGGPATSMAFRADLNTFATGPNSTNNLIPNGNNGLALANTPSATSCRSVVIPVPVGSQIFDSTDNTYMYIKIAVTTPGGCTFRLYSIMMNFSFNYL